LHVQRVIKLPFRTARSVYRSLRGVLRPLGSQAAPEAVSAAVAPSTAQPAGPPIEVRVEDTPNPDARKLVCDVTLVAEGSIVANAPEPDHPAWVAALFGVGGVRTVFATRDFVTVTRSADAEAWDALTPRLIEALQAARPR